MDYEEMKRFCATCTDEEFEKRCSELSMKAMRAQVNRDVSRACDLRGQIEVLHAIRTGDYGDISGRTANRNRLIFN